MFPLHSWSKDTMKTHSRNLRPRPLITLTGNLPFQDSRLERHETGGKQLERNIRYILPHGGAALYLDRPVVSIQI